MLNRKNLAVTFAVVLLLAVLAGCSGGNVMVPDREVAISMDDAMAAQNKAMEGLMMGSVEWTEGEFSSLLTALIEQNLGEGAPITGVTAWFEPDNMLYLRVGLPGGLSADLGGQIMVEDNMIKVDLSEAGAAGMAVSGAMLDVVEGAINRALDDPSLGVAVNVETGDGTLALSLGQ
ncbi:MAG: hypothetical protein KDD78_20505 [Caldilineaceae bacterium]|nr:hypothetical protein [Caldilineaceae bacterium]